MLEERMLEMQMQLFLIAKMKSEIAANKDVTNYLVLIPSINSNGQLNNELDILMKTLLERDELLVQSTDQTEIYKAYGQRIEKQKTLLMKIINNEESTLKDKLAELEKQLAKSDSQFGELPQKQAEFGRLSRMYGINEKFYALLLEKKAEFSITRAGFVPKILFLKKQ
ncbi:MAG: hypothetical protein IPP71_14610 [Bacteroidetes bacterium]|nr:hypothetical protein [Bacteroidota bacterium]